MKFEINENMLIRNVLPSDWEDIMRIERKIVITAGDFERLQSTFWVVEMDNQLVAYLVAELVEDFLFIKHLVVASHVRGQGLGTLFLAFMKEICQQNKQTGLRLISPYQLLSYFSMNGFVDENEFIDEKSDILSYEMTWRNKER